MAEAVTAKDGEAVIAAQQAHWDKTFAANPSMFGLEPSESGLYATNRFVAEGLARVLELGAGQGRDTIALLRAGFEVDALDYSGESLSELEVAAGPENAAHLVTSVHARRCPSSMHALMRATPTCS